MQSTHKAWLKRAAIILAIAVLVYILLPLIGLLLGFTVVLSFGVLELIGYAIFLVGMPLFLWVMLEAGYKVFIRPSWRVWHIRRIRNRRLLKEAMARESIQ